MKTLRFLMALVAIAFSLNLAAQGKVGVYIVGSDSNVAKDISEIPEENYTFITEDCVLNNFKIKGTFSQFYVHVSIIDNVKIYIFDGLFENEAREISGMYLDAPETEYNATKDYYVFNMFVAGTTFPRIRVVFDCKIDNVWNILPNGNANRDFGDVAFDDVVKNRTVCAWSKENAGTPHPADIYTMFGGERIFRVRAGDCVSSGEASAWDNQFWIQAPRAFSAGEVIKISFRYFASKETKVSTQVHGQYPSNYLHWQGLGDLNFTTEWQTFEQTFTVSEEQDGMSSIAFNLNYSTKEATEFYFDDLCWEVVNPAKQGKVGVYVVYTDDDVAKDISDIPEEDYIFLTEDWEIKDVRPKKKFTKFYVHISILDDTDIFLDDGQGYMSVKESKSIYIDKPNTQYNPLSDYVVYSQPCPGALYAGFKVVFKNGSVGINGIHSDEIRSEQRYNLKGQRVGDGQKGLIIQGGKIRLVK